MECDYLLKAGVIIHPPGDPKVYTNHNLTNEVAKDYLRLNPV